MPTRASRLLQQHDRLLADNELVSRVTSALLKGEFFEQAGELYERVGQQGQALDCYRRGEVNRIE
jgi:intraflagellar transport protein 172